MGREGEIRERGKRERAEEREGLIQPLVVASKMSTAGSVSFSFKEQANRKNAPRRMLQQLVVIFSSAVQPLQKRLGHFDNILVTSVAFLLYA